MFQTYLTSMRSPNCAVSRSPMSFSARLKPVVGGAVAAHADLDGHAALPWPIACRSMRRTSSGCGEDSQGRWWCARNALRHNTTMQIARPTMTISRRQFVQLAAGAAAWPVLTAPARAQAYPARPVRVVVPVAPGGANDTTARLVAQKLSDHLGQQFYCENQVGAGGNIAFAATAKAPKDGYTLLAAGGNFIINPSLYARVPYDPFTDFAPVSLLCSSPHVVAVHPSVPAANMQEFVALLKANPGKFSYGSAGRGTPAHLAGELFRLNSVSTSRMCRSAAAGPR